MVFDSGTPTPPPQTFALIFKWLTPTMNRLNGIANDKCLKKFPQFKFGASHTGYNTTVIEPVFMGLSLLNTLGQLRIGVAI